MHKQIKIVLVILLVLTMFSVVSGFDYNEDDDGNPFLESEFDVRVPQMSVRNLFILQPSSEPSNPELGTIYFDANSKRIKLYDGTGWYALALEKVSSVSKEQVKKDVEKKSEVQTCEDSIECGEWGDCINNYQSMTCISIDENCNKYEDTETRDCISDFELESAAKGSHDVELIEDETSDGSDSPEEGEEGSEESTEAEEEIEEETKKVKDPKTKEVESDTDSPKESSEIPEELFDITFDLEESSLSKSDELIVWITLQNFGKRYVPARLIYVVTDIEGNEIYKEFEEIRVYSDESIIKRFEGLVLEKGVYTLSMKVEYASIVEEFSDEFSVEEGVFNSIKRFFTRMF